MACAHLVRHERGLASSAAPAAARAAVSATTTSTTIRAPPEQFISSEVVSARGHLWRLVCYLSGDSHELNGEYASIFLSLVSDSARECPGQSHLRGLPVGITALLCAFLDLQHDARSSVGAELAAPPRPVLLHR